MSKLSKFCCFVAFTGVAGSASAEVNCDSVLNEQAFDRSASSVHSSIALNQREELCSRDYKDEGEAQSAARSAGFSFNFSGDKGAGSTGRHNEGNRWDISDTILCTASLNDLKQAYAGDFESVVASIAVNAWLECVTREGQNQLYMDYLVSDDGGRFTGSLRTTVGAGPLVRTITGISVVGPGRDSVRCVIAGKEYSPAQVEQTSIVLDTTGTSVACWRTDHDAADVAFQTSQGDLPFVALPTTAEIERVELRSLRSELEALRTLVDQRDGIRVLRQESYRGDRAESLYDVDLEEDGLLLVSASARAGRVGSIANAGVYLHIYVDGQACASDLSFEGESASITFFSSASCAKVLEAGKHTLSIIRQDHAGITEGQEANFDWQILELRH